MKFPLERRERESERDEIYEVSIAKGVRRERVRERERGEGDEENERETRGK